MLPHPSIGHTNRAALYNLFWCLPIGLRHSWVKLGSESGAECALFCDSLAPAECIENSEADELPRLRAMTLLLGAVDSSAVVVDENDDDFERPSQSPRESVAHGGGAASALGELDSGLREGVEATLKLGEYSGFHSLPITV